MQNRNTHIDTAKAFAQNTLEKAKTVSGPNATNYNVAATSSSILGLVALLSHLEGGNISTKLALLGAAYQAGVAANQYYRITENSQQLLATSQAVLESAKNICYKGYLTLFSPAPATTAAATPTETLEPERPKMN